MANEVVKVPLEDEENNLGYCKYQLEEEKGGPDVVEETLELDENKWWFQCLMLLFLHLTLLCIVFQVFLKCPTWNKTMVAFAIVQVVIVVLAYLMRHYGHRNMGQRKITFAFLLVFSATEMVIFGSTLTVGTETDCDRCYLAPDDVLLLIILTCFYCVQLTVLACTSHPCWVKPAFKYKNLTPSVS